MDRSHQVDAACARFAETEADALMDVWATEGRTDWSDRTE